MNAFSIRDIDDLKPQERRYDVPLEEDFVVSVLPNGIRTWVYVYEQDGRLQRRTLGVHPDMGPEAARVSLTAARRTRRALQEALERSAQAAAGRPEPRVRRSRSPRFFAPASAVILGLLIAAGAYVGLRENGKSLAGTASDLSSVATSRSPHAASAASLRVDSPETADPNGDPDARANSASTARAEDPTPAIETLSPPIAAPAASIAVASLPTPNRSLKTTAGTETPVPQKSAPAHQVPKMTANAPGGVTRDTHVARAVLTSDVVRREPVNSIGPEVHGDPGDVQHVFFFTEVRGLGGQNLRYRWLRNGQLEAEIPLAVGTTWRWRSYSRKDLLPDDTGEWRVQLVDEVERVLAETRFIYRSDAPGTQSADAS